MKWQKEGVFIFVSITEKSICVEIVLQVIQHDYGLVFILHWVIEIKEIMILKMADCKNCFQNQRGYGGTI